MALLNYSLLETDEEGLWSLTAKHDADKISNIIYNIIGCKTILDGTAGIGGNTISFCSIFKNVIAIEKNTSRYNMLLHNTKLFNLNNLIIINDTCMNHINSDKYDALFLDPPWGGYDYKKQINIRLKLDNYSLINIIDMVKERGKLCVLKLPYNYMLDEFIKYDYKVICIRNYIVIFI